MASVRFRKIKTLPNGDNLYQATFHRVGGGLPKGPQLSAAQMMEPRPDPRRRFFPQGKDLDAPRGTVR